MYEIILDGTVKPGETVAQVINQMSALFKTEPAMVEKIFRDAPTVIQRQLTWEKAVKYKAAVEKTGALCRIEPDTPIPSPTPPPPPPPPLPPVTMYTPAAPVLEPAEAPEPRIARLDTDGWKSLGIGLGITVVVLFFQFLSFIFHYLITLVHEIGHAAVGWLYGYPSIPAFDFVYGGGITIQQEKNTAIVVVVYLLLGGLFYLFRWNRLSLVILSGITLLYSLAIFTEIHQVVILFMGHGTELIFGAIFLFRAMSGSSVIVEAERPLYAFLAFFIFFIDFQFAFRLMSSAMHRADYEDLKGGGHWMDFSRIAEEYLHVDLSTVAAFFLILCIVTPILAYLFFRHKKQVFHFLAKLLPIV